MAYSSIKASRPGIPEKHAPTCERCGAEISDRHASTQCQDCYDLRRIERTYTRYGIDLSQVDDETLFEIADADSNGRKRLLNRVAKEQRAAGMGLAA